MLSKHGIQVTFIPFSVFICVRTWIRFLFLGFQLKIKLLLLLDLVVFEQTTTFCHRLLFDTWSRPSYLCYVHVWASCSLSLPTSWHASTGSLIPHTSKLFLDLRPKVIPSCFFSSPFLLLPFVSSFTSMPWISLIHTFLKAFSTVTHSTKDISDSLTESLSEYVTINMKLRWGNVLVLFLLKMVTWLVWKLL